MNKWEFVITRNDPAGTQCWLQPSWGDNKVLYGEFVGVSISPALVPPKAGPGMSDCKSHFKPYKLASGQKTLRFKKKQNQQTAVAA